MANFSFCAQIIFCVSVRGHSETFAIFFHCSRKGGLSLLVPHRRYLAVFGGIWRYLAVFGGIWRYLAVFGGIWRYLAVFGGIWRYLAVFGGIWRYLAVFGGIWRYLAVFGGIWRYLAVFGGIWYLCVLCVMSAEWLYTVVGIYQHNGHK